jgi:hypothetical protein
MVSVFILDWSAWPKNAYIKTPRGVPWGCGGETWNHETKDVPTKIGGGNAAGVAPDRFSNLSEITNTATMMNREYSTSGLWVCGSSLLFFISYSMMFRCHMSYPTWLCCILYNSYVVDLYFIGWSMSCDVLLCSWCISRCILLPRSLLLVLIQLVCESVRGGWCVLDGVTW